jgi:hypothetical protein
MVSSTSTLCPAHSATWVAGMPALSRSETPHVPQVVRPQGQRRGDLCGCQADRTGLLPHVAVGRAVEQSPLLAAEQPTVWCEPVAGDVVPQDGDQLRRDGD